MIQRFFGEIESRIAVLPFVILITGFLVKVLSYSRFGTEYWLDEIIVTTVSKQGILHILETIKADPHPPGFYLLLKFFSVDNIDQTRLFIVLTGYVLTFLVLVWGYRNNIIQKNKLSFGLSLFLSSYTYLEITAHIKQDVISFPIFLFYLLNFVKIVNTKNGVPKTAVLFAHLSAFFLLFFGYIYYAVSVLGLVFIVYRLKKVTLPKILIAGQLVVGSIYFAIFGLGQLTNNLGRFSWTQQYFNSFWRSFGTHLTGEVFDGFFTDAPVMIFMLLLYLSLGEVKKFFKTNRIGLKPVLILLTVYFATFYIFDLFVRTRYIAFFYLLVSIPAGWGLGRIFAKSRLLGIGVLSVFFISSATSFVKLNTGTFQASLENFFMKESGGEKFGFLDDHAMYPLAFAIALKNPKNLVPLNIFHPEYSNEMITTIEFEHLMLEGRFYSLKEGEISGLLKRTGLKNFFYKLQLWDRGGYYDPDKKVLGVLDMFCDSRKSVLLGKNSFLFAYRNCSFP